MKAVVYFSAKDISEARMVMAKCKMDRYDVHWASADEFEAPRDLEFVDEVILVSPSRRIEAAYQERGVKITRAFKESRPAKAPDAAKAEEKPAAAEAGLPAAPVMEETHSRLRGRRPRTE